MIIISVAYTIMSAIALLWGCSCYIWARWCWSAVIKKALQWPFSAPTPTHIVAHGSGYEGLQLVGQQCKQVLWFCLRSFLLILMTEVHLRMQHVHVPYMTRDFRFFAVFISFFTRIHNNNNYDNNLHNNNIIMAGNWQWNFNSSIVYIITSSYESGHDQLDLLTCNNIVTIHIIVSTANN
jgi:hypothetical protein